MTAHRRIRLARRHGAWLSGLALCLALVRPVWAEPALRVALEDGFRPLAMAADSAYEHALLRQWSKSLDRPILMVSGTDSPDLILGPTEAGIAYYQSEPAAFTARQGGVADLNGLTGGVFCIVSGSPHVDRLSERFSATPERFPRAAEALAAFRSGRCPVLIEDRVLLEPLAERPEWQAFAELLPSLPELAVTLRVSADDSELMSALQPLIERENLTRELMDVWVERIAEQACALDDQLDCR